MESQHSLQTFIQYDLQYILTSTILAHWVPLPAPGPPSTNTTLYLAAMTSECTARETHDTTINLLGTSII